MLQKLSIKTGFTKTEIRVIGFLSITLIIGFVYLTFLNPHDSLDYKKFDYSEQDSLFLNSGTNEDSALDNNNFAVDENTSSTDILELGREKLVRSQIKKLPNEKSINLNSADMKLLMALPGIGNKTAARIIECRMRIGKFKSYNDLLQVKGIGNIKLEKIKKYSYIK